MNEDNVARKALLTLSAAIAEASSMDFALCVTSYLAEIADGPGCDAATSELLWDMISVVQPPSYTPRGLLTGVFA
jgi:hypothetical protein